MLFGKRFEVINDIEPIFKRMGNYEEFYAFNKDGELEYEILDPIFGQPSPANWDKSSYAKLMRSIASDFLQEMIDKGNIKLLED
jgi:hypothetical protein